MTVMEQPYYDYGTKRKVINEKGQYVAINRNTGRRNVRGMTADTVTYHITSSKSLSFTKAELLELMVAIVETIDECESEYFPAHAKG